MIDDAATADSWRLIHLRDLERREDDLRHKLERCVPPVDQHRRELERVRAQLASARRTQEPGQTS